MVKAEIKELSEQKETLEHELTIFYCLKDPNDSKNVIMEIRAGTGLVTKQLCLQPTCSVCTLVMQKCRDGKQK